MRSSRPTPDGTCPTRHIQGDTQTQRRSLMKTEAEAGGTGPQPGACGAHRGWKRQEGPSVEPVGGGRSCPPGPQTSGLQSWEGKFPLLKSICGPCHSSPRTLAHAARRAWPRGGSGDSWVFSSHMGPMLSRAPDPVGCWSHRAQSLTSGGIVSC